MDFAVWQFDSTLYFDTSWHVTFSFCAFLKVIKWFYFVFFTVLLKYQKNFGWLISKMGQMACGKTRCWWANLIRMGWERFLKIWAWMEMKVWGNSVQRSIASLLLITSMHSSVSHNMTHEVKLENKILSLVIGLLMWCKPYFIWPSEEISQYSPRCTSACAPLHYVEDKYLSCWSHSVVEQLLLGPVTNGLLSILCLLKLIACLFGYSFLHKASELWHLAEQLGL